MERSLTVLLPVHNAQATLRQTILEILEVLPELTPRFDVLIADDGSTDATTEIAAELARDYPQIRVVCRGRQMGRDAVIRQALDGVCGEVVLLWDAAGGVPIDGVHQLWHSAAGQSSVTSPVYQGGMRRLLHRAASLSGQGGYRLMERSAMAPPKPADARSRPWWVEPAQSQPRIPNFLARLKRFALEE